MENKSFNFIKKNNRAREILKEGKTLAQIDLECALWAKEIIDDYTFKPIPLAPTSSHDDADEFAEANRFLKKSFSPVSSGNETHRYIALKHRIKVENSGNYYWLNYWRDVLAKNNLFDDARVIQNKLDEVTAEQLIGG